MMRLGRDVFQKSMLRLPESLVWSYRLHPQWYWNWKASKYKEQRLRSEGTNMNRRIRVILAVSMMMLAASMAFAKQGAVRTLYTVPNTTFIEQPTGESVV